MQNDDMVPIIIILCICVCIYVLGCEMGLFLLSGTTKVQSWIIDTKYPYILKKGVRYSPTVFTLKNKKQNGMKCSSHCYYKEQSIWDFSQRIIWSEFFRVACAFWHRPWCLMLPWRYLKVGSSLEQSAIVGWEGSSSVHRPSFPPGFFHGVSRVGEENEWSDRAITLFSAPSLWTTERPGA